MIPKRASSLLARALSPAGRSAGRARVLPRTSLPRVRRALSTPASYASTLLSPSPTFFSSVQVPLPDGSGSYAQIPAFRALDADGALLGSLDGEWRARVEAIPEEVLGRMYETMTLLPGLDNVLSSSQRQGRISFYMTSHGEEGGQSCPPRAIQGCDAVARG